MMFIMVPSKDGIAQEVVIKVKDECEGANPTSETLLFLKIMSLINYSKVSMC
jgi:hypothetical protein